MSTNMKRSTISIPQEMKKEIIELRKTDEFCQYSYSGIIRHLIQLGLILNYENPNNPKAS